MGKEYIKAVYCHPNHLTYLQNTSCEMLGWMKHMLESRLLGQISITLGYADDTTLMTESEEKLKNLLMKLKKEREKAGLKLNIQKMKIMEFSPITSWKIDGETMEAVTDYIFLGSKITVDGDGSHKIKRHLVLARKSISTQTAY